MSELALKKANFTGAELAPSANFGPRVDDAAIDILILHYTGMPDDDQAQAWLQSEQSQVSSHYFVHEDGRVVQLVAETARAWHAGRSAWKNNIDINSSSIGIEIANPGHEHGYRAFPDEQILAVIALCQDILARQSIEPERVLAHSDIAPLRKEDPGELFPWQQLAQAGIGHYLPPVDIADGRYFQVGDEGEPVAALQAMFGLYGYDCPQTGQFDAQMKAVVVAFQRHFRPLRVDGIADQSTIASLHQLLQALPYIG
ncbi:MAG: N-acetylmuramoyl-L-alanine amidase [Hyphomicrobiales bacterium]|nr:MAG: N-acetylmuramoyl-L-alanine amidase [Hyphomicrobiales bacterium]